MLLLMELQFSCVWLPFEMCCLLCCSDLFHKLNNCCASAINQVLFAFIFSRDPSIHLASECSFNIFLGSGCDYRAPTIPIS